MRSGILVGSIVVVLCACVAAMERPAQVSPGDILIMASGDPNDPNGVVPPVGADPNRTWDPARHLAADWESVSVSMTSRLYNPVFKSDVRPEGPQWSLSLTAILDILDGDGLIGWSTTPISAVAYDLDGSEISSSTPSSSMVRWYQQPRSLNLPAAFPTEMYLDRCTLSLPIVPDKVYPDVLSRVDWTMNVLVAENVVTVDIPFEPNETWVELTPGMEILVEQATVEAGKYQYRIKTRYDSTQVAYLTGGSVTLWRDQAPPPAAVLKLDVLNAKGQSIRNLGGGGFSSSSGGGGSNNQMTGTASGSGSCDACGTAAIIRFTLVFGMYEREARFVFENIPVPAF